MKGFYTYHNRLTGNTWIVLMLFVMAVFSLQSCQEKTEWELEMENELRLVVDGKITNERAPHEVMLSLPVFEINGTPRPVSGATVFIFDGDSTYHLTEDEEVPGRYLTNGDLRGVVNRTYYLGVEVDSFEFMAAARMVGATPISYPGYRKVSSSPPLYEAIFQGNDNPSKITLEMDWSHLTGYDTLPAASNHAIVYGYYFNQFNVDVNQLFSPQQERVFFPPGTQVIITKESLSPGYAEYLRGMLSETAWNGGLFDVKPGDPFTNLSAGAIGYFSATTVLRDTLIFQP